MDSKYYKLERIVKQYVQAWQSDFYDYDIETLSNKSHADKYLWIVRKHGTHLIEKEDVATSETVQYYLNEKNRQPYNSDLRFYEIDTDTLTPHHIDNIEAYVEQCKIDNEYQQMYSDYDVEMEQW